MFKHFLAILLLALISSSYAFVQHNTLTANVKSSSSMKMELDTKELFKKNVQMWKGMYAEGGMRAFADSFADDGKLFLKVDTEHELTGPAEILNFMQDWKVAYDIQDIQFSEPACSKTAFACTWSARWRAKASGIPGTTKGFVMAMFDDKGMIKEYHDVMDKAEYEKYLEAAYVPQF
mmetsp:Transcript_12452/g.17340  ORF Transcript_12452/g.17340 Transcript_12452/m.17340 type:complete len:177 (-) Transcript_12452:424-954(-)